MSNIGVQLARIEEVQQRLLAVLASDTLEGMEELSSELSSRLQTLAGLWNNAASEQSGPWEGRLGSIATVQRELAAQADARLSETGAQLRHASASRQLGHSYSIDAARTRAALHNCMDLTG